MFVRRTEHDRESGREADELAVSALEGLALCEAKTSRAKAEEHVLQEIVCLNHN
jgi:hypothetical protein